MTRRTGNIWWKGLIVTAVCSFNHQIIQYILFPTFISSFFPREESPRVPNNHCIQLKLKYLGLLSSSLSLHMDKDPFSPKIHELKYKLFDGHIPKVQWMARLGQDNHSKKSTLEGKIMWAVYKSLVPNNSEICQSDIARTSALVLEMILD